MKQHLSYGDNCPLCRAPVPKFFKTRFYHANVDKNYLKYVKRKYPAEYEAQIQNSMRAGLPNEKRFPL